MALSTCAEKVAIKPAPVGVYVVEDTEHELWVSMEPRHPSPLQLLVSREKSTKGEHMAAATLYSLSIAALTGMKLLESGPSVPSSRQYGWHHAMGYVGAIIGATEGSGTGAGEDTVGSEVGAGDGGGLHLSRNAEKARQ